MAYERTHRLVRGEEDARELLARFDESGLNLTRWCRENGIEGHSLYWWKQKLRCEPAAEVPQLLEVRVQDLRPEPVVLEAVGAPTYDVVLANGRVLRVRGDFEARDVHRLIAVLEARC